MGPGARSMFQLLKPSSQMDTYRRSCRLDLAEPGRLPVLQNQEPAIDFAYRQLSRVQLCAKGKWVANKIENGPFTSRTAIRRNDQIQHFLGLQRPNLLDGDPKFLIGFVHFLGCNSNEIYFTKFLNDSPIEYLASFWRWDSLESVRRGWWWTELYRQNRQACSFVWVSCRPVDRGICCRTPKADPCFSTCRTFPCSGFYP